MATLDLAAIGNCAIASLVDRNARHVWFCFPRLDGDPLFNALVNGDDPQSGFMDIEVEGLIDTTQSYIRHTPILQTRMRTKIGEELLVTDLAPRLSRFERSYRPPLILRRIEPVIGHPRIRVRLRPTFDWGAAAPKISFGSNHVRFSHDNEVLRVTADLGPSYIVNEQSFLLARPVNLFIGIDESLPQNPDSIATQFLHETTRFWVEWVRNLALPFEWQDAVIRAAITLKLCNYEETGAIVAALTTSIPEAPNTGRNWDYRFCWLRDAFFTVNALNRLGSIPTMEHFVRFMLDTVVAEGAELNPLYGIVASTPLTEREAPALAGYRGMGPVRVGNAATSQLQNDVFGSVVLSAAQVFWDSRVNLTGGIDLYRRLRPAAKAGVERALNQDSGVWEFRGRTRLHTYSVAMCWAAAQRMALIAKRVGSLDDAVNWDKQANVIRQALFSRAATKDGWISGALDEEIVDASTLLLPQLGLISARSEPFLKTLRIVEKRLFRSGFVLRYDEPDDFGLPETAFLVCTFWYIDGLAASGRVEEARNLFTDLLERRNSFGLFSEDVHPTTKELWGNFPQAYSLVGLINSAFRLSSSWEEGLWQG
jgi:hypothetical protein